MVIGNGSIATVFKNFSNKDYVIFASGVSDSSEKRKKEFEREENLLKKIIKKFKNKTIIYFSTTSIYTKKTKYVEHKKNMENILKTNSNFLILRIPQIISKSGNKKNLINFLLLKILKGEIINVEMNTERSVLDIEDLKKIVYFLVNNKTKNKCLNFSGVEFISVLSIIKIISNIIKIKAKINLINKKSKIYKHNSLIFKKINLNLSKRNYTKIILKKYLYGRSL